MKRAVIGIGIVVIAVIGYALVNYPASSPTDTNVPLRPAWVAAEGKVETMPGFDIDLGTGELSGRIAKITVKPGDPVEQGQVVIVLENTDLQAQVQRGEQELVVARQRLTEIRSSARAEEILAVSASLDGAKARREEAHHQLERHRELQTKNMASQALVDEREAALKSAEAAVKELEQRKKLLEEGAKPETVQRYRAEVALAQAALEFDRQRLEKTTIRSPIGGTVIERYMDEGEGVTPEIPILAIADLTKLWVNAEVDETDVGRIRVGDAVKISSNAYPGTTFDGTIREIADYAGTRKIRPSNPAINLGLKVVQVKIALQEQTPLRLGMTVDVRIVPGNGPGENAPE